MRHLVRLSLILTSILFFRGWIVDQAVWVADQAPQQGEVELLLRAVGALLGAPSLLAFALFSRIDESRALENASRQRLRDAIRAEPGLGLTELRQRLALGWGTTVYHLNRLESAGLVSSSAVGRRRVFFLPEHDRGTRDRVSLLANRPQIRLLEALHATPNASQQELATASGMSLSLANRYLRRLETAGLVASEKRWRERRYHGTERLRAQWGQLVQRELSPTPTALKSVPPSVSLRETNAR